MVRLLLSFQQALDSVLGKPNYSASLSSEQLRQITVLPNLHQQAPSALTDPAPVERARLEYSDTTPSSTPTGQAGILALAENGGSTYVGAFGASLYSNEYMNEEQSAPTATLNLPFTSEINHMSQLATYLPDAAEAAVLLQSYELQYVDSSRWLHRLLR